MKGFTLIELMVVVAVIAILALLAVPSMQSRLVREQIVEAVRLADIAKAPIAASWTQDHSSYFPQSPSSQGDQPEVRSGCAGQYSLDDVAHEGDPPLGFGQLRRSVVNET